MGLLPEKYRIKTDYYFIIIIYIIFLLRLLHFSAALRRCNKSCKKFIRSFVTSSFIIMPVKNIIMHCKNSFYTAFCCLLLLIACNSNAQQTNLSVDEFQKAISQSDIQLVDVRTPAEYQSGHLSHAMLADWNNETEFKTRAQSLDKSKPVY